jgi:Phage integrase family.
MERILDKTFADAAESYVRHGGEGKYLPRIVEDFGHRALADIVPPEIVQLAKRLLPEQSNSSRNRMVITPVGAVLNHAHQMGWSPLVKVRRFKTEAPLRKKAASQLWIHAFIRQCDKDQLPHLAALVLFMSQTGARVSEAIELTWGDVDLKMRTAVLRKVKMGRSPSGI